VTAPRHRGERNLVGAKPKQRHHVSGGQKRIGDDGAVGESERGHRVTVTLGNQRRADRRGGAVELGQELECGLVGARSQADHHWIVGEYVWGLCHDQMVS
jgi:hypothetical protein